MSRRWRRTRARARRARDRPARTDLIRQKWLAFFIEFSTVGFFEDFALSRRAGLLAGWPPLADAVESEKNWALHRRKARGSTAEVRLHHATKSCQQHFAAFNQGSYRPIMTTCDKVTLVRPDGSGFYNSRPATVSRREPKNKPRLIARFTTLPNTQTVASRRTPICSAPPHGLRCED